MAQRLPFLVAELGPYVDPFVLHLFAALAEKERNLIATRSRQALKAAKAKPTAFWQPIPCILKASTPLRLCGFGATR